MEQMDWKDGMTGWMDWKDGMADQPARPTNPTPAAAHVLSRLGEKSASGSGRSRFFSSVRTETDDFRMNAPGLF